MRNKYALKSLKHAQIFQNFSRAQLLDILSTNENIEIVSETMNSKEKIIFRVELGVAKQLTANQRNRVRREMLASIQHTRVSSLFFEVCEMWSRVTYCQFDYTFRSVEIVRSNCAGL